jgi:phosphatidylglycerol:prolipoprotein diacylglycerol transferase
MYPELFSIGPLSIRVYGLLLAISFFVGVFYAKIRSSHERISFDRLLSVAYFMIFGGIIGARLSYVALHLSDFSGDPLSAINPFGSDQFGISGLNLYGGIVLGLVASFVYIRLRKLPLLAVFDTFAPPVALGIGITRIGCFFNGCCFGTPTNLPWGVSFPEGSIPYYYFNSAALHPAQLYSSAYGILLFVVLHLVLKRKRFDGQVMGLFFMVEAVFRHLIEYVRYYESEMHLSFLGMNPTWNQLVSISLFLLGMAIYLKAPRKLYRDAVPAPS